MTQGTLIQSMSLGRIHDTQGAAAPGVSPMLLWCQQQDKLIREGQLAPLMSGPRQMSSLMLILGNKKLVL